MPRPYSLGDTVQIQLYNSSGRRLVRTGNSFTGVIVDIDYLPGRKLWQVSHRDRARIKYLITRGELPPLWVWNYEIVRRINT